MSKNPPKNAAFKNTSPTPSNNHAEALNPFVFPAPSLALLAMEFRAPWEFGALLPAWPLLQRAPRGDGHAVIVFPGLSANDTTTTLLRRYLRSLGHAAHGWEQGFNFGPRAGVMEAAKTQLQAVFAQTGQKVSLVGWSLGGIYARELAKELPGMVRCVITMGTPFAGGPKSTNAWRLYELTSGRNIEREAQAYALAEPPLCPTSSVYSRSDGVVAWQGSIQSPHPSNPHLENIEVVASHFGIGMNPSAWWAVADRLAQPGSPAASPQPPAWQRFQAPPMLGLKNLVFPNPVR